MKVTNHKILAEPIKEEVKSEIIIDENGKKDVVAKVLAVGEEVKEVAVGDKILVFNVYPNQIFNHKGQELMFVVDNEGFFVIL